MSKETESFWDKAFYQHVAGNKHKGDCDSIERRIGLNKAVISAQSTPVWAAVRDRLRASMEEDMAALGRGVSMSLDNMRFLQGRVFVYESLLTDTEKLIHENEELERQLDGLRENVEDPSLREPLLSRRNP